MKKFLFLLIISAVFMSCAKKPADYFPLKIGDKWDFNFQFAAGPNKNNTTMTYSITDKIKLGNDEYFKFESTFGGLPEGSNKSIDYYRETPAGIVIRSVDTTYKDEFVIIPADMKVGATWDANYPQGKRKYMLMSFEDVIIGDMTYKDCVKISYEDDKAGQKDSGFFYFAKGVGLVKIHIDTQRADNSTSTTDATLGKFSQ